MITQLTKYKLLDSKVKPYNSNYPQVFQKIKELIAQVIPEVMIEHIGSTAIPGIYARRIVDILIPCPIKDWEDILCSLI